MHNLINLIEIGNSSNSQKGYIFLAREDDTKPGDYMIAYTEAKKITDPLRNLIHENYNLRLIIRNQWRIYKYSLEYNNYLLGNYAKEDFLMVARRYARPFVKMDDLQIISIVDNIFQVIDETLSSGEISQLINVDPADIEKVLNTYPHSKIAKQIEKQDD